MSAFDPGRHAELFSAPSSASASSSLPSDFEPFAVPRTIYTRQYCEENVYLLVQALEQLPAVVRSYAAFVSNHQRHALLFHQKASRQSEAQASWVVWDYHVVAIAAMRDADGAEGGIVIDPDSKLGDVVSARDYVQATFRPDLFRQGMLEPDLESRVRLVPARSFLDNFASDRSHMLASAEPPTVSTASRNASTPSSPRYMAPIPPYPAIAELGEAASREDGFGIVLRNPTELLEIRL
ncbi:hypothetical protein JCM10212_000005 [Sporobolomyces blumeae]